MHSMFNTSMQLFLSSLLQNQILSQLKEWLKRKNQQMPDRGKKKFIKNINGTFNTNFSQTFYRLSYVKN